ncbi:MAG TPA: hypothetical protein VMV52_09530 [Candidatus Nanopelagicaceae bacterium]|nr:hypothetical protein [Candidatus Nanopelagicaceae bacterium]
MYSSGLPKSRNKFIYYVKGFIRGVLRLLVLKFGPSGKEVDVKDDSLDRWYVNHYKYDSERKQVRHVFLKAFSNQKGQMKYFNMVNKQLQARKMVEEVPRHEHITGGHYEPGYHARVRENRRQNGGVGSNFVQFGWLENEEGIPGETK